MKIGSDHLCAFRQVALTIVFGFWSQLVPNPVYASQPAFAVGKSVCVRVPQRLRPFVEPNYLKWLASRAQISLSVAASCQLTLGKVDLYLAEYVGPLAVQRQNDFNNGLVYCCEHMIPFSESTNLRQISLYQVGIRTPRPSRGFRIAQFGSGAVVNADAITQPGYHLLTEQGEVVTATCVVVQLPESPRGPGNKGYFSLRSQVERCLKVAVGQIR